MSDSTSPSVQPAAPPTVPGPLGDGTQSGSLWPSVLGILAVVVGALGTLGGLWAAAAPFASALFVRAIGGGAPAFVLDPMDRARWWLMAIGLGEAGLAALLLAAGILLLRRRRRTIPLCRTWAALKLALTVVSTGMSYVIQEQTMAMVQSTTAPMSMPMTSMPLVQACLGLAWGWALPVVLLVWLARPSIRDEVAGWPG